MLFKFPPKPPGAEDLFGWKEGPKKATQIANPPEVQYFILEVLVTSECYLYNQNYISLTTEYNEMAEGCAFSCRMPHFLRAYGLPALDWKLLWGRAMVPYPGHGTLAF